MSILERHRGIGFRIVYSFMREKREGDSAAEQGWENGRREGRVREDVTHRRQEVSEKHVVCSFLEALLSSASSEERTGSQVLGPVGGGSE